MIHREFLSIIVLNGPGLEDLFSHGKVDEFERFIDGRADMKHHEREGFAITRFLGIDHGCELKSGPYMVIKNCLWPVRRLHDDTQNAFLAPVRKLELSHRPEYVYDSAGELLPRSSNFALLNDGQHGWDCCSLAVPSRMSAISTPEQPLRSYRVAIKDVFDLEGINTSAGNKAYLSLYPEATTTASSITSIISKGAWILGKTKLSTFLSREEASEAVDFPTAWNPRGDGYQGPGGSSSGSAAAVAAYEWLDIGIGTDSKLSLNQDSNFEMLTSF